VSDAYEAIVIGAGPAGLATSRELSLRGVQHLVLERGGSPGHCWQNAYDSLRLHTGKHLSSLPGLRFSRATPLFPSRNDFVNYLHDYARRFRLPVECGIDVLHVGRNGNWQIESANEAWQARSLVLATGIMSNPVRPSWPGQNEYRGALMHSVDYRRPEDFAGKKVLVVGVGNSGGEIASDLAQAGVGTAIAVRSGANVVPRQIAGVPIQYISYLVRKLPRRVQEWIVARVRAISDKRRPPVLPRPSYSPLDAIPLIGFHLVDAIAAGKVAVRPALDRFTMDGVRFADGRVENFDVVILATGFRPALQPLDIPVHVDTKGFAVRVDRVRSADFPDLFFVGHNYDATGGIRNIAVDAKLAAEAIAGLDTGSG
jgi:cation diffusion facilitator CzcD-associated flavoprotein CzcO